MARTSDPGILIEPAWKASLVHDMPCASGHILPSCHTLAACFCGDFETAVLHVLNGGQNLARGFRNGRLTARTTGK